MNRFGRPPEFNTADGEESRQKDTEATKKLSASPGRTAMGRGTFYTVHRHKSNSTSYGCVLSGQSGGPFAGRVANQNHDRMQDFGKSETERVEGETDE